MIGSYLASIFIRCHDIAMFSLKEKVSCRDIMVNDDQERGFHVATSKCLKS